MENKINTLNQDIIDRLLVLLEVKYIYKSIIEIIGKDQFLLIVILKGNCSSLTHELSSMVAKIFQEETDYLYRIFSFEYAQQQLKDNNLFFVHGCSWDKVVFHNSDSKSDSFYEYSISEKDLNAIQIIFEKENKKTTTFLDGSNFFIENNNLSEAAFMLHQYLELWFRYAALIIMGKTRKSHSIKDLQTYLNSFSPKLGKLFDTEIEEELNLLKLLDQAYVNTRYGNNYHINLKQIIRIQEKAQFAHTIIHGLFTDKISACQKNTDNQYLNSETCLNEEDSSCKALPETNEELILDEIKKLSQKHFHTLKPNPSREDIFCIPLSTDGYLETSFMMANLIKVCIMALEADYAPNRIVQEPEYNVKEVLGYILYMMPYEEMEFLDKMRDLLTGIKSDC